MFDRIFTEDELRLFEQLSPNDDGESFDAGFLYIHAGMRKKREKSVSPNELRLASI